MITRWTQKLTRRDKRTNSPDDTNAGDDNDQIDDDQSDDDQIDDNRTNGTSSPQPEKNHRHRSVAASVRRERTGPQTRRINSEDRSTSDHSRSTMSQGCHVDSEDRPHRNTSAHSRTTSQGGRADPEDPPHRSASQTKKAVPSSRTTGTDLPPRPPRHLSD